MSAHPPIDQRLVVYGTLVPGGDNHHIVEPLDGQWTEVVIRGRLGVSKWRTYEGLPAFQPDPDGREIPAWLLESDQLPEAWGDLDAFEGPGYRRIPIPVHGPRGENLGEGWIYEALNPDEGSLS